jgi:hypothetical protein
MEASMLRQIAEARATGSSAPFLPLSCFLQPSAVRPFVSADDGPVARSERGEDRPPPDPLSGLPFCATFAAPTPAIQPSAPVAASAASSSGNILIPEERGSHGVEHSRYGSAPSSTTLFSTAPSTQTSHLSCSLPVRDEFPEWLPTTSSDPVDHASSNGLAGTAYLPTATASDQLMDGFYNTIPMTDAFATNMPVAAPLEGNIAPLYSDFYGTELVPFLFSSAHRL